MQTSHGLVRQHAFMARSQMPGGTEGELASAVTAMLQQQSSMFLKAMREMQQSVDGKMLSMERSLGRLAEGELDCPRLFVLLPMEASSSRLMQLVKREFLKDKYRLVFLDPVTGYASHCGKDGQGYKLELPKKWLVENRATISAGLKVVKVCAAAGRLLGLPLPSAAGLPSQAVSKAEVEAVKTFEAVYDDETDLVEPTASAGGKAKGSKAVTGQVYKQLRKLLKEQCNDEYLVNCDMKKEKAQDGSIEFVTAASTARFVHFGQECLVWNDQALKQKAVEKAAETAAEKAAEMKSDQAVALEVTPPRVATGAAAKGAKGATGAAAGALAGLSVATAIAEEAEDEHNFDDVEVIGDKRGE